MNDDGALCGNELKVWNGDTVSCLRGLDHRGEHRGHCRGINWSWPTDAPCSDPGERFYRRGWCGCGHPIDAHANLPEEVS